MTANRLRLWFGSKVCYDDRLRLIDDPMKPQSTFNIVSIGMVFIVALIGCGQKGGLYLNEDAPANTDFLIYDTASGQYVVPVIVPNNVADSGSNEVNTRPTNDTSTTTDDDKVTDDANNY